MRSGGETRAVDPAAFGGMLPSWPHFPAAGHVSYRQFAPAGATAPGEGLWRCLDEALRTRQIPLAASTPATRLCVHDGTVTGARVLVDGEEREIGARGGVVLASGGFEYDLEARDAYLPLALAPVGHPGNTGDTLRFARDVGAALWHMSAFFGWFSYLHPEFPAAFTLDVHAPSFIYVDGDGRRFADETGWEVHDKVRSATAYLPRRTNRPRLPGFVRPHRRRRRRPGGQRTHPRTGDHLMSETTIEVTTARGTMPVHLTAPDSEGPFPRRTEIRRGGAPWRPAAQ